MRWAFVVFAITFASCEQNEIRLTVDDYNTAVEVLKKREADLETASKACADCTSKYIQENKGRQPPDVLGNIAAGLPECRKMSEAYAAKQKAEATVRTIAKTLDAEE